MPNIKGNPQIQPPIFFLLSHCTWCTYTHTRTCMHHTYIIWVFYWFIMIWSFTCRVVYGSEWILQCRTGGPRLQRLHHRRSDVEWRPLHACHHHSSKCLPVKRCISGRCGVRVSDIKCNPPQLWDRVTSSRRAHLVGKVCAATNRTGRDPVPCNFQSSAKAAVSCRAAQFWIRTQGTAGRMDHYLQVQFRAAFIWRTVRSRPHKREYNWEYLSDALLVDRYIVSRYMHTYLYTHMHTYITYLHDAYTHTYIHNILRRFRVMALFIRHWTPISG